MFQNYDEPSSVSLVRERVEQLRAECARHHVSGFIIPRADEHQGEYVPPHAERLRWLTGFSGSAGMAVILEKKAALFIDGRYTIQASRQTDLSVFTPVNLLTTPPARWLEDHLEPGQRIAYDPWLHTVQGTRRLQAGVQKAGGTLVATKNLVDAIWPDQPPRPLAPVVPHAQKYAGLSAEDKRAGITETLQKAGAGTVVLTMPDSIAWLFNVRGNDVAHSPLPLSFALVHAEGSASLFMDSEKAGQETRTHLGNTVTLLPPGKLGEALDALGAAQKKVLLDPASCADWIHTRLEKAGATIIQGADPCELPRARKNATEIEGARAAHIRDGRALTRFLAWLDHEAPSCTLTEITATRKLEALRAETGLLRDISFDTISGSGPNGAIVHYRVTTETDRTLQNGELFLVDSGAQYFDGTTDVTRTIAIGTPAPKMVEHFTLVLKGHIALASARFPVGTCGTQLDTLARLPLWQAGLDFDHGTGHGVGSYLCVHEGPQRISRGGDTPLEPGMIVSNEPGYYREGAYGIRIENLLVVTPPATVPDGERPMLGFETLTLAPIDQRLINSALLTRPEREWLNAYHKRVHAATLPAMQGDEEKSWLEQATQPL